MIATARHPLQWYIDRLAAGPIASLLYGDGEFFVAMRERTGQRLQCHEVVTPRLEDEMLQSLDNADERIVRGTDLYLIEYWNYHGGDRKSIEAIGRRIEKFLAGRDLTFVDGVIWENTVRAGGLGPFLRALQERSVVMVGNRTLLAATTFLRPRAAIGVPDRNAFSQTDDTFHAIIREHRREGRGQKTVYLLCMGLGAIPLACRLMPLLPEASFFDLGSVLDVFAGIGSERGWRQDLYQDPRAYQDLLARNREGTL